MPIVEVMEEMGLRVLVDKWDNHNTFDAENSRVLLWRRPTQFGVNGPSETLSGILHAIEVWHALVCPVSSSRGIHTGLSVPTQQS